MAAALAHAERELLIAEALERGTEPTRNIHTNTVGSDSGRQVADNLVGHGDAPVLSEVGNPSSSRQDAPVRYWVSRAACRSDLPRERFSRVLGMFSSLEVKVLYPT